MKAENRTFEETQSMYQVMCNSLNMKQKSMFDESSRFVYYRNHSGYNMCWQEYRIATLMCKGES